MIKNILATIGLAVVLRKGYELYCEHKHLQAENEQLRQACKEPV